MATIRSPAGGAAAIIESVSHSCLFHVAVRRWVVNGTNRPEGGEATGWRCGRFAWRVQLESFPGCISSVMQLTPESQFRPSWAATKAREERSYYIPRNHRFTQPSQSPCLSCTFVALAQS